MDHVDGLASPEDEIYWSFNIAALEVMATMVIA